MRIRDAVSLLFPFGRDRRGDRVAATGEDYARLFSSGLGQRVLADILNEGGLFRPHVRRFDERSLTLMEGRRWLALDIFAKAGGARARLGPAMTRDDIGEALNEPNTDDRPGAGAGSIAAERGTDGEPLFAESRRSGPLLADGDE